MTQDEIKEMIAKIYGVVWTKNAQLRAFAKLVAAKEREACAKLCEENAKKSLSAQKVTDGNDLSDVFLRHHASAHFQNAQDIRARGQA